MNQKNNNKDEPLVNTVYVSKSTEQYEYETVPGGMYLAGLVKIKNTTIEREIQGVKTAKPGFRLTFRLKEHPACFVGLQVTATTSEKGRFTPLLKKMTGGSFPKDPTPEHCFNTLTGFLGGWFDVMIDKVEFKGKDRNFVIDDVVLPTKQAVGLGNAVDYFKALPPPIAKPSQQSLIVDPASPAVEAVNPGYDGGHDLQGTEDDVPW